MRTTGRSACKGIVGRCVQVDVGVGKQRSACGGDNEGAFASTGMAASSECARVTTGVSDAWRGWAVGYVCGEGDRVQTVAVR
jgi:hypothetical protein